MIIKINPILRTDSYKLTHHKQYVPGITKVMSYLESRVDNENLVFFGLQALIKLYLQEIITVEQVENARSFSRMHFGSDEYFNYEGWMYIATELKGKLPLKIKAVPEGTIVPSHNVLMTVENTDPKCYWLTNHVESILMKLWSTITVASNSFNCAQIIRDFLPVKYPHNHMFMLHDFGYRGTSSEESSGMLGMAHLLSFCGTDNCIAIEYINQLYDDKSCTYDMFGFSVPASEHSVACSYGITREDEYFLNMLDIYPSNAIVSVVSDTYNVFDFVKHMSETYKDKILAREGKVVFRPDSGDMVTVNLKLADILWETFGGEYTEDRNGKRLKKLHPKVGILQGDGIYKHSLKVLLTKLYIAGWDVSSWVFGSGGGLLQRFTRDDYAFAIKACYGEVLVKGEVKNVNFVKNPKTDSHKKSKAGKLMLVKDNFGRFSTLDSNDAAAVNLKDELVTYYENGELVREETFTEIRDRVQSQLK